MNYHILNNSIVLNFDGRTETIAVDDKRYSKIIEAIRSGDTDNIADLVDSNIASLISVGFELKNGTVYYNDEALPSQLNSRIVAFLDAELPVEPLLNFWRNLKRNPSYNSREALYSFLEHNGHPITPDGCFIAYRGVTNEFKDCHTKTFDNSVGAVCEMPRNEVDDNPNNTCSSGLHVACFSYAHGFGSQTVEVKVNPVDVVTVPTDYNGTKMRVCRFEVVSVAQAERNDVLCQEYDSEDDYDNDWDSCENWDDSDVPF